MSKHKKNVRKKPIVRKPGKPKQKKGKRKLTFRDKLPVIKFIVFFAILVSLYYIGIATEATASILESYTKFTAWLSAVVLNVLGEGATSNGYLVSSDRFMLMVGVGCEGSEPIVLYLSAIIAFPILWRLKWSGILWGTGILFFLNLFRIIGLYYSGIYFRSLFEILHSEIFPIIFIFIAMILWLIWINRALRKLPSKAENAN